MMDTRKDGDVEVDDLLDSLGTALRERLGDDKVAFFLPDQYPGFSGNPNQAAGIAVDAPPRPDTNQSTYGMIFTVPVDPDPGPYFKIMSPVVVGLDESHAEMALSQVNNLNKQLLRAHLVFKNYEIGSAIEAQSGLPAVDGKLDLDLLITLLGETVGMADMVDDQLIEALGAGRTILPGE